MEHLTCDEAETLLNLHLDGLLDGADAARLDAHLAVCPACQATLAELEALSTALAKLPDAPVPPAVLAGVLERIPVPAPAPANGLARWRWLLGVAVSLEAMTAALLLLLNWPLVSAFVWGLIPTTALAERTAGHHLAYGINAWLTWFNVQGTLVQAQWQALADQVSSLALTAPAPELVVQALVLLAAVLVVWVAGNRILAVATVDLGKQVTSNQ